ncbi:hypothetical protein SynBIOSE41_03294 [Synechococcus sp. BIOS-E4-1]|nr:hypothetical protein SynBIOSE41_03294 [Synechococcus sp. BIOS-E4-1]
MIAAPSGFSTCVLRFHRYENAFECQCFQLYKKAMSLPLSIELLLRHATFDH